MEHDYGGSRESTVMMAFLRLNSGLLTVSLKTQSLTSWWTFHGGPKLYVLGDTEQDGDSQYGRRPKTMATGN